MTGSISNVGKRIGRPKVGATPLTLRIPPDLLAALDCFVAGQSDPKLGRTEAIRHILKDWLTDQSYLRHREDPEGAS